MFDLHHEITYLYKEHVYTTLQSPVTQLMSSSLLPGLHGRQSLYEILGVESSASQSEIKQAYRQQLLAIHPDKTLGQSSIDSAIIGDLKEAYGVLLNDVLRNEYDKQLLEKAKKLGMNADGLGLDQYSLDAFEVNEVEGIWSMACPRCETEGGMELNEEDLENGTADGEDGLQLALQCQSCSLWIKVKYYMGDDDDDDNND